MWILWPIIYLKTEAPVTIKNRMSNIQLILIQDFEDTMTLVRTTNFLVCSSISSSHAWYTSLKWPKCRCQRFVFSMSYKCAVVSFCCPWIWEARSDTLQMLSQTVANHVHAVNMSLTHFYFSYFMYGVCHHKCFKNQCSYVVCM